MKKIMKNVLLSLFLGLFAFSNSLVLVPANVALAIVKVNLCHKAGDSGNWVALEVSESAWQDDEDESHSSHESDYLVSEKDLASFLLLDKQGRDDWCKNNAPEEPENPTPMSCPFDQVDGRTIVEFDKAWLIDDPTDSKHSTDVESVNLPAGAYKVSLASWDGYLDRVNHSQPAEQIFVVALNGGSVVAESNPTEDLADSIIEASWNGVVDENLVLNEAVDGVKAQHVEVTTSDGHPNSVYPICASFDLLEEEKQEGTIWATKVVCDYESDLPNWGDGKDDDDQPVSITETTAQDYVTQSDGKCRIVPWKFERKDFNDSPDDNITHAAGFAPFSLYAKVPAGESFFIREQANPDYIPFSGTEGSDVSAEFYCHNDVNGYDNLDYIGPIQAGKDYFCVGFNVLERQPEEPFVRSAEITNPSEGENVSGTVSFTATLTDKDNDDSVQWAVRKGSCDAGVNTVFGNVDGYSDSFSWDNTNFEATTDVSSWEEGLYCFVFNPSESSGDTPIRETRKFNVVKQNEDGGETTNESFVVKQADLETETNRIVAAVNNSGKWFFYNDETDVIDNTLGSFVSGPDTAPIGDGSTEMTVSGSQRRNIATYQFKDIKLADITELSFSTYSQLTGDGANGLSERAPYLNFNVDFDNSDTWQNRLVFVPGQNGVVTSDTWQTWDAVNSGNALWSWSGFADNGNKWPDNNTNEYRNWNDIISSFPNAETRSTDSWLGFRVGEPYADGFTGNVDNFVIGIKNGLDTTIKTFDFEPTAEKTIEKVSRSRSSGSYIGASLLGGQVLGAETTCGIYVDKFLKKGLKGNDKDAVMKVQQFLNDYMKSGLKVDGIFGTQTEIALKAFQIKHADKILTPWGLKGPTGIFYLTTQTEVNNIMCPELNLPIPTLTPMASNPLFPKA